MKRKQWFLTVLAVAMLVFPLAASADVTVTIAPNGVSGNVLGEI